MRIDKSKLGIAGEYAVAAQLCRQGVYAQLTLGNLKRADLLVLSEKERMARIEVKSKQTREWPNCKGIYGENVFLILVDFESKDLNDQPDFYILSVNDWVQHVKQVIKKYKEKHPERRCEMDGHNCPVY